MQVFKESRGTDRSGVEKELAALEREIAELKRQLAALPAPVLDPKQAEELTIRLDTLIARHARLQLAKRRQDS